MNIQSCQSIIKGYKVFENGREIITDEYRVEMVLENQTRTLYNP